MQDEIQVYIDSIENKIIERRRDFHKFAESAWTEFRTASIIARQLKDLGYEVKVGKEVMSEEDRMGLPDEEVLEKHYKRALQQGADKEYIERVKGGFTAVVGILDAGDGPTIALRFDIDAVDVSESNSDDHLPYKEGFNSINENVMHACGHDGHGAIGLGVAQTLMEIKDKIQGKVKLIFQPAEEGVRGAKSITTSGVLDDVDYILAGHIGIKEDSLGELYCGVGGFLATSKFDAYFTGVATHAGGSPEKGRNALLAGSTAALNLHAIPRHSEGATRINVGKFTAGTGRNVIPANASMMIETRGDTSSCTRADDHLPQNEQGRKQHDRDIQDELAQFPSFSAFHRQQQHAGQEQGVHHQVKEVGSGRPGRIEQDHFLDEMGRIPQKSAQTGARQEAPGQAHAA